MFIYLVFLQFQELSLDISLISWIVWIALQCYCHLRQIISSVADIEAILTFYLFFVTQDRLTNLVSWLWPLRRVTSWPFSSPPSPHSLAFIFSISDLFIFLLFSFLLFVLIFSILFPFSCFPRHLLITGWPRPRHLCSTPCFCNKADLCVRGPVWLWCAGEQKPGFFVHVLPCRLKVA